MTCSMLSASIAVAVPRKYIRKPGWRNAANETGATATAPPGWAGVNPAPGRRAASVAKSSLRFRSPAEPGSTASVLESCALCGQAGKAGPIESGRAGGDQLQQVVAQQCGEGHRHMRRIARCQRQADILQSQSHGKACRLIALLGD